MPEHIIEVFEWEIWALIRKQDSALIHDPSKYVLSYNRNRYYQARDFILASKRAELIEKGVASADIKIANKFSHHPIPGWSCCR